MSDTSKTVPVYVRVGHHGTEYEVGTITAGSGEEAASELPALLRAVADAAEGQDQQGALRGLRYVRRNERRQVMRLLDRILGRPPVIPPRQWFRADDGTFYRNCPLIARERDEVLAWTSGTSGRSALVAALSAEYDQAWRCEVIRKPSLEPGDVEAVAATFREAYPRNPGLWALDGWKPQGRKASR